jgi:hypothetical protein
MKKLQSAVVTIGAQIGLVIHRSKKLTVDQFLRKDSPEGIDTIKIVHGCNRLADQAPNFVQ